MKHLTKLSLVAATAAAVTFGGSVYAFAGWIIDTPATVLEMTVAQVPAGNAPAVEAKNKNAEIAWEGSTVVAGVQAESYIVTRFGSGAPVVVCDHVTTTACRDKSVPQGTWTWKVRPVFKSWLGDYSPNSAALTFTKSPPTAAELVSATTPAVRATPDAPSTAPAGGRAVVTSPAPTVSATKPPASPAPEAKKEDPPPSTQESASAEPSASPSSPAEDKK
ncbi:hypothetical protein [Actinoplanes auranticolor]|uniref:Uncharacterized protein n=1 Tax=Actinoplanes auranticolor TaxID=47988 RepID=A0A919VXK3_9ACTN|nr:hypothetical protein [Actinoplanes auranticolor]GIM72853.1 hypothetical protein Aau02nite_53160 [Actinoplanes auranticolor]